MKKVLIIDPGVRFIIEEWGVSGLNSYFPRGAMSIVTWLRLNGVDADFFFLDSLTPREDFQQNVKTIYSTLEEVLKKRDYSLVAIGGPFTLQYPAMKMLAEMCRELSPRSHIALGGVHVTFMDEVSLMEIPAVDSIVRGEGEWTVLALAHAVGAGTPLASVRGITWRDREGIHRNPPGELGDLKELPLLDYGLISRDLYRNITINLISSRGCAFACTFCCERRFWENRVRLYPVDYLIEEIKRICELSEYPLFSMQDSMVSVQSSYFAEFCRSVRALRKDGALRTDFAISHVMSRIDTLSEDGLRLFKETGIRNIGFGVESFSPRVLARMNKKITPDQVLKACALARRYGLFVSTCWIFGHPGDTPEECEKSIRAVEDLYRSDLHQVATLSAFVPYPGTPAFQNPLEYGLEILPGEWDYWDRYSLGQLVIVKDYPPAQLQHDYMRAWEVKLRNEGVSILKYYGREHIHHAGNEWKILVAPFDLRIHRINPRQREEFWNSFVTEQKGRVIGIFYSRKELHLQVSPLELAPVLEKITGELIRELGGTAVEEDSALRVVNMNRADLNEFMLEKILHSIALRHCEMSDGQPEGKR